jgi:hypothetical protein
VGPWTLNVRGDGKEGSVCLSLNPNPGIEPQQSRACMQPYTDLRWGSWSEWPWVFVPLWSANAPDTSEDAVRAALNGFNPGVALVFGYHNNQFGLIWRGGPYITFE